MITGFKAHYFHAVDKYCYLIRMYLVKVYDQRTGWPVCFMGKLYNQ